MEKSIVCFVLSPIMFKGKRIVDELVELTKDQVKGFQKIKPCPIRVVASDNKEDLYDAGLEPVDTESGTDAHLEPAAAEPEPKADLAVTVSVDNEPAAKAEAKVRNKAAK